MAINEQEWASISFEERQRKWAGEPRTFRQNNGRNDRPQLWEIRVDGDRVFTRHGLLDGAMQDTNYQGKIKNKGKKHEITSEQDAMAEARRDCRKKWDFEGYDEYTVAGNIDRRNENVSVQHLLTSLPGSFCLYKPENTFEKQKKLVATANAGKAIYTLKRDGIAKLIVKDYHGNLKMYSRRARAWSDTEAPEELPDGTLDYSKVRFWFERFPHLLKDVTELNLPNGTMMATELIWVDPATGKEKLAVASGFTKGHTDRALEDQKNVGLAQLYWWDMPFYDGKDTVREWTPGTRFALINNIFVDRHKHISHITPIEICNFATPEIAEAEAKKRKIEGWVVLDPTTKYEDRGWNLKGKPDRPPSCAKLKATGEDDFVAYWNPDDGIGEWGTGNNEKGKMVTLPNGQVVEHGGVGSMMLYQYNSTGELVPISKCSSGMLYELQAQLRPRHFPMVAKCEFKGRSYISEGEKTNALRHPVFVEFRTDKTAAECINTLLDSVDE